MRPVAVGIFCKTPSAGRSKTRLSPPLRREECSLLSACFIRDLAATVHDIARNDTAAPYAVYTPAGTEQTLRALLPASFRLLLQPEADFGARPRQAAADLIAAGHAGAILVNADSPTLPASILRAAVGAVRSGDVVVLGPAIDGGYTLIGLSRPHARLFEDIPWSTPQVHRCTVERAAEIGVPVVNLPCWYDVDDEGTLRLLLSELAGVRPAFAEPGVEGAPAPATRELLAQRMSSLGAEAAC
jgi:rSAM/selenodomain-associated transferase 1